MPLFFQALEEDDVFVDDLVVHHVFDIATFFFGEDDRGLGQLFEMVADGGLCQVDIIIEVHAVEPVVLFFDLAEDLKPGRIREGLGDLFRSFCVHLGHMISNLHTRYTNYIMILKGREGILTCRL